MPAMMTDNYGAAWVRKAIGCDLSPFGERIANLLDELFDGIYHWDGAKRTDWTTIPYIRIVLGRHHNLATWDGCLLTRLVLLAHREAIRVEINPCNFGNLELYFHQRQHDGKNTYTRHPTIEQAIEMFQSRTTKKD